RTIERHKKKPAFAATMERGRAKGRISVRRSLFEQAAKGNSQSTIFLAKNLLGFKDYVSNEHSGPEGSPIPLSFVDTLNARRDSLQRTRRQETGLGRAGQPHFPAQAGPLVPRLLLRQVLVCKSGDTDASCTGHQPRTSILRGGP